MQHRPERKKWDTFEISPHIVYKCSVVRALDTLKASRNGEK